MTSDAPLKRPAEQIAQMAQPEMTDAHSVKRQRFDIRNPSALPADNLEDDAVLDADVIGKRGQLVRRQAVNIDGYESDSDNENFNTRAASKAQTRATKSKAEQDHDMFADLEDDFNDRDDSGGDEVGKGSKGRKAVRFLNEDEIEGQHFSSRGGGHVSADFSLKNKGKQKHGKDLDLESSSESEVDDETRARVGEEDDDEVGAGGKKKHAPKLDAFNVRNEREDGAFDDQGNFVRKAADPDAVHDSWLDGLSKKDIKKAAEAAEKREDDRRRKEAQDDAVLTSDALNILIKMLEIGESAIEALARLGKRTDKRPKWQRKRHQGESVMDTGDSTDTNRKQRIEQITSAADILISRGRPEIYEMERELLLREYHRETGEEWQDTVQDAASPAALIDAAEAWEYRYVDGSIHGPYDSATMRQWLSAGYFEGAEFRAANNNGKWMQTASFG